MPAAEASYTVSRFIAGFSRRAANIALSGQKQQWLTPPTNKSDTVTTAATRASQSQEQGLSLLVSFPHARHMGVTDISRINK